MVGIKFSFDISKPLNALTKISYGDFSIPLARVGQQLVRSTNNNFKNESDPNGNKWKPLSPVTIALRRKGKGSAKRLKILQDTGRMKTSITSNVIQNIDKTSLEFGTNVEYAKTHQFGGESQMTVIRKKNVKIKSGKKAGKFKKRKFATAYTKTIQVPARPFLGISTQDRIIIEKIFVDWYKETINA